MEGKVTEASAHDSPLGKAPSACSSGRLEVPDVPPKAFCSHIRRVQKLKIEKKEEEKKGNGRGLETVSFEYTRKRNLKT